MQVLKQRLVIEEGFEEAFRELLDSIKGTEDSEIYFDALELQGDCVTMCR